MASNGDRHGGFTTIGECSRVPVASTLAAIDEKGPVGEGVRHPRHRDRVSYRVASIGETREDAVAQRDLGLEVGRVSWTEQYGRREDGIVLQICRMDRARVDEPNRRAVARAARVVERARRSRASCPRVGPSSPAPWRRSATSTPP